ncbi:hypothetical protein K2O51_31185 (plasmid) [Cupriavidus pinatubonensis]|uniref:hypothetical protein n=1 Tax=Cupriavidus pinatubonensis TaxID=248026 RepID=UPI001C73392D|nr:hypothetical protein [Cupriavidus pinatubonensis]QYY33711.1 hypothetical protein K2O51_31185 [Cupriavidus pinatubonensis]
MMNPLQHAKVVWNTVSDLPIQQASAALAFVLVVAVVAVLMHEGAHWSVARIFGVSGQFRIFARRGESRLWFLSVFAIKFREEDVPALSHGQWRAVAAAGPFVDVSVALSCFTFGLDLPGPVWLTAGVALGGLLYFLSALMNSVPLPFLKNDGWVVVRPSVVYKD